MGEIAEYFKRERYITRRLSLLVLGGTVILVPVALANAHGRISARVVGWVFIAFAACVGVVVVFILRAARAKFPKTAALDDGPLDNKTRRKLRRRIFFLEFFVVVYAIALLYTLSHARNGPWLPLLIGVAVNLLMQAALIKAIRRLKKKLKAAMGVTSSARAESAS
jgi:cytochrome bd-type quinol oxidase subunit 2